MRDSKGKKRLTRVEQLIHTTNPTSKSRHLLKRLKKLEANILFSNCRMYCLCLLAYHRVFKKKCYSKRMQVDCWGLNYSRALFVNFTPKSARNDILSIQFPRGDIYICESAIYIVKHRDVNKERKFLPNYIIFQDLDKSLIYLSYFQ